ncbi:MAG: hypothetical protein ACM31C_00715, partial [Acidobacteriota bacterium]
FPQERSPTLLVTPDSSVLFGLVLAGGDRLGLQRWSAAGYVQPALGDVKRTHYGVDIAYLDAMLAPVLLIGELSLVDWSNTLVDMTDPSITSIEERRTRDAMALAQYTYRGTLTSTLGGVYTDDYDAAPGATPVRRHVGGPQASLFWESAETTRYTEERRALIATTTVAVYPHALSTFAGDITDVGGTLGAVVPLPLGRRHTLRAFVRGRALIAPSDTGLLQLGGDSGLAELWASRDTSPAFDDTRFPPNLRFVEPLRGYEDYAITTDRVELAQVAWRYPIIVDRGVAATLRVLPTSFVRELDVELFGAGALDKAGDRHAAAGGALSLRVQLLRVPLIITYQLARRLVDDRAITQLVGVAPGP